MFAFISNRLHPEAALQEIELVNPRIELQHFQNGTWNFTDYFPHHKRKLQLQTSLKIRDGLVELQDYHYGHYVLQKIDGRASLNKYMLLTWDAKGISDFNDRMKWISHGKCRIDRSAGAGEITADHVAVVKVASFIPPTNNYRIDSGSADVNLKFAWNREGTWLENGSASLRDVVFVMSQFKGLFIMKQLDAEFSPRQCKVLKAYLVHNQTVIKASGCVNTKTAMIKADLSATQVSLEDLERLFPIVKEASLQGEANLRLAISGTMDNPIMDGELLINNAQFMVVGQKTVEHISGWMTIRDNNLRIERLEGTWNHSLLGVYGNIKNLLNPRLDLKLYGFGLSLRPDELAQLSEQGLKPSGEINFVGEITGKPRIPQVSGEISFDKLTYQDVPISNLKLKLEWDSVTESLKVLEMHGDLWEGHLAAKGEVRVTSEGVQWQLSGQISELNLSKTTVGAEWGVDGKVSTDLILKGHWSKGAPFQAGSVLGIFKGEKLVVKDLQIEEANGVFSWVDGNLNIDSMQAKIGEGIVYGHLSWNPAELLVGVMRKMFIYIV